MTNAMTYKVTLGCLIAFLCNPLSAQQTKNSNAVHSEVYEANKRLDNYLELKKMGFEDKEIFEDLGNASFLTENYGSALFWYNKLKEISEDGVLPKSYGRRYQHALGKTGTTVVSNDAQDKDWLTQIKADYQIDENLAENKLAQDRGGKFRNLDFLQDIDPLLEDQVLVNNGVEAVNDKNFDRPNAYKAPMAVTADGKTAYFTKGVLIKPAVGIFSKKEMVHKIFKAQKVNGQWKNIVEVALCPKNYSAQHPSVSQDGKRLFFASDMPGTFGKYDIYVADIKSDGSFGIAKNLGKKVNTKKNDLHPNLIGRGTLFFASEGRKGQGGLDVFMTEVGRSKVGLAVNLGSPINSKEDDFSISLMIDKGTGYVMTNRGNNNNDIQRVAFSYSNKRKNNSNKNKGYRLLEAFNSDLKIDYTSSTFEDE
ncbi:MAG: cell envelope biogenesis protein OmpA [Aurantibacter sp.]